jgi:hypothetical protein
LWLKEFSVKNVSLLSAGLMVNIINHLEGEVVVAATAFCTPVATTTKEAYTNA